MDHLQVSFWERLGHPKSNPTGGKGVVYIYIMMINIDIDIIPDHGNRGGPEKAVKTLIGTGRQLLPGTTWTWT